MNNQKLIIYDFNELFHILKELQKEINFEVINVKKNQLSNILLKIKSDYLIITKKIISNINHQILIDKLPIKIFKLIEKLNIKFLKKNFSQKSEINIGRYKINLNSRELYFSGQKLKLTEKESSTIIYLSKSDKPIKIEELQKKVWEYNSELETHTVETHIYRLRKKILKTFHDKNFITSNKNGYQIS